MPHRPNQRLPGLERRPPLPAAAQGLAVGRDRLIGDGNEAILREILEEIRNRRNGQEAFSPRADLRAVQDQFVGSVDISTALTNLRVPTLLGQVLTILDFPQCLTTFEIRIGNRDAAPINILTAGNQIRSGNAFRDIFVTTAPASPSDVITFMSGPAGTEFITTDRHRIVDGKGITLRRIEYIDTDPSRAVDLDAENIVGPCSVSKPHTASPAGDLELFQCIPANRCVRAFGQVHFLKLSGSTPTRATVFKATSATQVADSYFKRAIISADSGPTMFEYDSGFVRFEEMWVLIMKLTLGNATGQELEGLHTLELY